MVREVWTKWEYIVGKERVGFAGGKREEKQWPPGRTRLVQSTRRPRTSLENTFGNFVKASLGERAAI
ncbi:hypothetical protein SUGI_0221010 [Cryptomeria japonica]|nr:hypothetical protein SUGI_0221010 [Cryptomeria japonica]